MQNLSSYEPIGNEKIAKLNDNNSYKWTYEIRMLLQSKDLWKNCENENLIQYSKKMMGIEDEGEDSKEKKEIPRGMGPSRHPRCNSEPTNSRYLKYASTPAVNHTARRRVRTDPLDLPIR